MKAITLQNKQLIYNVDVISWISKSKVQKTTRVEVGGAGTLKYRKSVSDDDIQI